MADECVQIRVGLRVITLRADGTERETQLRRRPELRGLRTVRDTAETLWPAEFLTV
jgi:hypothetical protein